MNQGAHSGLRQTQTLLAGQPMDPVAHPMGATALGGVGPKAFDVQQAARQPTAWQAMPMVGQTGSAAPSDLPAGQ